MKVSEIMTREIQHVRPDESAMDAAVKMRDLDIGSLPVYDGMRLHGMISDRDLAVRLVAENKDPRSTPVMNIMSPEVISCHEDDDVDEAALLMQRRLVRRLVVMDHQGRLKGIVSLGDVATQQSNEELVAETIEQVSEPIHPTFFHHSAGVSDRTMSGDKNVETGTGATTGRR